MRTNLVRLPVLVRFPFDFISQGVKAMEFYAFNELMLPPDTEKSITCSDSGYVDDSFRKRPFTVFNSCPYQRSIAYVGNHIYVVGGSMLSSHVEDKLSYWAVSGVQFEQIAQLLNEETKKYLNRHIHIDSLLRFHSNRVIRFQCQKFLDSLLKNNQTEKTVVGQWDEDASNDSLTYWETCPSMSIGRSAAHLLHLGDKLFAIGGNNDGEQTSLVEVFDHSQSVWTPLFSEKPPHINPIELVSAAIEETSMILVGSNDSFYLLEVEDAGNQRVQGRWKTLLKKCPSKLLSECSTQPGLVTNKHYVLWHSYYNSCIYGLHLFSYNYFTVSFKNVMGCAAYHADLPTAKLVDLGEGILCLTYTGIELLVSIDGNGAHHVLCDRHCITFKINYDRLDEIGTNMPFPGIELETTVVSRYKCYVPGDASEIDSAFAMDVPFPHEKKVHM